MLSALEHGASPVIHGDGTQSYDFVDVRDCARANVLAMASSRDDRFYNVGTGVKTSIGEVASLLIELLGSKAKPVSVPTDRPFVRNRVGCTRRAAEELGFSARIPLDEGLKHLVGWRRERSPR
jgi:UDP-glucose 4-epimerase